MKISYSIEISGSSECAHSASVIAVAIEEALMNIDYDATAIVDGPYIDIDDME